MVDKVQKIIAEVERLKDELIKAPNKSEIDMGRISAFEDILLYIESLSEEPVNKNLEEEINRYFNEWTFDDDLSVMCDQNGYTLEEDGLKEVVRHFANWQKEQMMKDAIDGLVICDEKLTRGYRDIVFKFPDNLQVGDKVKLIIVKED